MLQQVRKSPATAPTKHNKHTEPYEPRNKKTAGGATSPNQQQPPQRSTDAGGGSAFHLFHGDPFWHLLLTPCLSFLMSATKLKLPQGKINVRFRQMRGVWQVFAGRTYLDGANADTPTEALAELTRQYNVPTGTPATIHNSQLTKIITL